MTKRYSCDEISVLISGYLDDELSQQQQQRLFLHVQQCASCQAQLEQLQLLQQSMQQSLPREGATMREQQRIQQHLNEPKSRATRWLGWLLMAAGLTSLLGYGLYQFWQDPTVPVWMKFSFSAFWLGALVVFLSVLRQRLNERKSDRYNKVKL
jgi:anti-sigma factor RsiW